ncbi:MAG: class B sortase [Sarcina sp.]
MKKTIKITLNLLLFFILCFSFYHLIIKIYDYKKADKTYSDIENIQKNSTDREKFFKEMKSLNENYEFWLEVENTNINYPVVKGIDNLEYLKKDFKGENSQSGAIFLDFNNNSNNDFNTLIYGHNMKNKTMFNNLEKFKNEEFFKQNNKIILTTNNQTYTYEIFAVSLVDGNSDIDIHYTPNNNPDNISSYIQNISDSAIYKSDNLPTSSDKIISLLTCSYEKKDIRTLVQAKLINISTN